MWFRVDDGFAFHQKTLAAGNAALGLWVRAGAQCNLHLTDGFVSSETAALLGTQAQAERLVKAGLWVPVTGGYQFHDWADCNAPAAQVKSGRKRKQVNQQAYRDRKDQGNFFGKEAKDQGNFFQDPTPHFPGKPSSNASVTGNAPVTRSTRVGAGIGSSSTKGRKTVTVLGTDQDPDFVKFWAAYPRKIGKGSARGAWKQAIAKRGADPRAMVEAAQQFGTERSGEDVRFTPHPATWLNGERYLDAPGQSEQELPWWEES